MRYVYRQSNTMQKRDFVYRVSDNNLYYQGGIYRTPTMLRLFTHNALKMKEKRCLIYEENERLQDEAPLSGETGIRTLGTVARTTVFETVPFNHSGISPYPSSRQKYLKNPFCISIF